MTEKKEKSTPFRDYALLVLLLAGIVLQIYSIFLNKDADQPSEQVVAECQKIRNISHSDSAEKYGSYYTEKENSPDPKKMLVQAEKLEKKAADMAATDIKDENLKRYKERYVKLYKQESQALREWAKLVPDTPPSGNQSQKVPADTASLERQLKESVEKQRRVEDSLDKLVIIKDVTEQQIFLIDGLAGYCDK